MEPTTCAACGTLVTNVLPQAFYIGLALAMIALALALFAVNWGRWFR